MERALIYGKEHTFLEPDTGLLYRNATIHQTAKLHTHTFYEIFVVTQGTALHMINGTIQTLHKGDMVFIRPQDTHTYEFHCSEDFRIINLGFSTQIFQSIALFFNQYRELTVLTQSELPATVSLEEEALRQVSRDFMAIGEAMRTPHNTRTIFQAKNCLCAILANYFFRYESEEKEANQMPVWFSALVTEMQKIDNLQQGFPKMRALAPCSVNHLCRLFKKYLCVTPTQYINERRLEYAVYLLTQTQADILTVSSQCGFNNLSHFYHLFKEKYHKSPAQFRKNDE